MSDSQSPPETEIRDPAALFTYDLAAVYDMEVKLVDALADLSETATNDNLSKGFALHRTETETQVRRVEDAFDALGAEPTRRADPLVDGLIAAQAQVEGDVADAALRNRRYLTLAIQTEQIEITSYEGLLATAAKAGLGDDVTDPLAANLGQEEKTLRKLEALAGAGGPDLGRLWRRITSA
ncbi:YciE/YciF ferroxidase family protein [Natrinema salifodinae]|uniref:Ferritin-like metal-binding protein YciE n=1 Tax=Natrinema salifodinae TaxID=1202768 RepID=A0A1I0MH86_9EURY|nr:DUF892 family protein [Natrinema salifodinae]SEV87156.1 Ferritin-like metal-binding protein YciE [Natrinema salifodinae]